MGCGDVRFLQGGVIDGSSIINSQITNSTITTAGIAASVVSKSDIEESAFKNGTVTGSKVDASELVNCEMQKLSGIDAPSAKVIADAIAVLPKADLVALASALFSALQVPVAEEPDSSSNSTISTNVFGDGGGVLGKPAQWGAFGEFVVPMYIPKD